MLIDECPLYVFFTLFGCWGGGLPRWLGHNLRMQFSSLGGSKMEISEPDFFDGRLYVLRNSRIHNVPN